MEEAEVFFCSLVVLVRRSLLCPHIPGGFQVEWMPIPCGFHPFHMESVWLRAQPFRRKFPRLFHMEIQWNLNIPWNIALESRWNPPQFIPWIPHYAIWIPHYSTWIPHYSTWIPYIPHGFHIIPHGFHIISHGFHNIPHGFHIIPHGFHNIPQYSTWIPHGFHTFPH